MKTLRVDLGNRSYPIFIGADLITQPELLKPFIHGKQVVIVTNDTIAPLYLRQTEQLFSDVDCQSVILPDGEQYKTIAGMMPIIDRMMAENIDRRVTLVALGGGVIGDMTGFAAAIYRRGVNFIQIPTTLLAQVDSSVGGKTGVNHPLGKNMIGAFYQPQCVLADINTLNTLQDNQLAAGLAEVIKYALIDDPDFMAWLEQNMPKLLARDAQALMYAIEKSCQDKARIVSLDEKEAGQRALLNLGHTFGHAIEAASGYGNILHGEAVAIGMVMAADLSLRHGWLHEKEVVRIHKLISAANLPTHLPDNISTQQMWDFMAGDKKVLDGTLRLVLFKRQAHCAITSDYQPPLLQQTLESFANA